MYIFHGMNEISDDWDQVPWKSSWAVRAVALRRHLSLLSNHQLRSPLQEGNFVTWPVVRLRHSEKLRCFYLDAAWKKQARRFHYERAYRASTFEITNLSAQKTRYVSGPLLCCCVPLCSLTHSNVGFVQTWCLVECDSRLCLSEIFFFFFKPSAGSNQFFFTSRTECLTLSCCIS